ncbi:hypothetical protein [Burkholderia sp. TSV86]|uniref:hypothetical protein n=1 Tax=Burkholderia sp. TSV86 TaxID=1385594 RepID=UPI00075BCB39|nr:hypothetical protein [Burkholderia sp. TSV86]KVE36311.1 hypothetical protein WS68_04725 [Burkholderia sp. TSV86]
MHRHLQLPADMLDYVRDIPIYRQAIAKNAFPILEKPEIARDFPDNWMTPRVANALATGEAEFVMSTGTHHARMQLIRPPYFLLNSYYRLWSEHPDIGFTWEQGCRRVSLTTVLATEHVIRTNAKKRGGTPAGASDIESRWLDARTLYLNRTLEPSQWTIDDLEQMLTDIEAASRLHPRGLYHLDCSSYHLAHFVLKLYQAGLQHHLPPPASIVHAYEYTPINVRRFLQHHFACPIVDLFGSTELGYLYYSNREGCYVPYLDKMQVELLPFESDNRIYSLIVSSIRNPFMPLIRYRSGDCVQTTDGSADPAKLMRFCGREKEMLHAPRRIVSQADFDDLIAAAAPQIFLYQLRTDDARHAHLIYTCFDGEPISSDAIATLRAAVEDTTGLTLSIEHRPHIAIGKSGKYAWLTK